MNFNWFWEFVEAISLIVLFYFQIRVWILTRRKNSLLDSFLPDRKYVSVARRPTSENEAVLTSVLVVDDNANSLLKEICLSINGYLKKNKGNAADFHLLKNIVDRHVDTLDEEIGHLLPVPLYLGLAGTMVGIVTGLMCIGKDVNSDAFVNSIEVVVGNIKYAMICSLVGLIMTTILSAYYYRRSKANMENQKNTLLDLLQTELLPHLNEDATATLLNMQSNLKLFNDQFQVNIKGFKGIMNDVHEVFDSQVELMKSLKSMDLIQMSTLNINVLEKLHTSTSEFEKFTRYLRQMNGFIDSTTQLTNSVNDQIARTDAIATIAQGVKQNIDRNQTVMEMLQDFLVKTNANTALLQASKQIDTAVASAIDDMRKHVEHEVEDLKSYTNKACEDLELLMQRERGQLDRLKNLEKLDSLTRAVQQMANDNQTVNTSLAKRIAELSEAIKTGPHGGNLSAALPKWLVYLMTSLIIATCMLFIWTTYKANGGVENSNGSTESIPAEDTLAIDSMNVFNGFD